MKLQTFTNGQEFSLGAELELRLLDNKTLAHRDKFYYIVENMDDKYKNNLASEFLASMVEINTPIYDNAKDLTSYLKDCIDNMIDVASKKDMLVATSGAYALSNEHLTINANQRYEKFFDEYKILLKDFNICGLHVHVGFENSDDALNAFNFALKYLPLFTALSASSPFFNEELTGIHSYRTKVFERLPKASIPQYFDSYEQMSELYELLAKTQVIDSPKDVWWDIRIQDELKTLEFRICDAVADFERIEAIVMLIEGICKLSKIKEVVRLPYQILKQNMWSASRYSMTGSVIYEDGIIGIKDALNKLIHELLDKGLIEDDKFLKKVVSHQSIAMDMIGKYNKKGDIKLIEKMGVFKK